MFIFKISYLDSNIVERRATIKARTELEVYNELRKITSASCICTEEITEE